LRKYERSDDFEANIEYGDAVAERYAFEAAGHSQNASSKSIGEYIYLMVELLAVIGRQLSDFVEIVEI
jgi:hypothetical protein